MTNAERKTAEEIQAIVEGMNPNEAIDLVVAYIQKTQKYLVRSQVFTYWAGLNYHEKVDLISDALS